MKERPGGKQPDSGTIKEVGPQDSVITLYEEKERKHQGCQCFIRAVLMESKRRSSGR